MSWVHILYKNKEHITAVPGNNLGPPIVGKFVGEMVTEIPRDREREKVKSPRPGTGSWARG